jgi:hypothetical protein
VYLLIYPHLILSATEFDRVLLSIPRDQWCPIKLPSGTKNPKLLALHDFLNGPSPTSANAERLDHLHSSMNLSLLLTLFICDDDHCRNVREETGMWLESRLQLIALLDDLMQFKRGTLSRFAKLADVDSDRLCLSDATGAMWLLQQVNSFVKQKFSRRRNGTATNESRGLTDLSCSFYTGNIYTIRFLWQLVATYTR